MNFFCEIIIKEQYHLFEKKFPDISEINKINGDSFLYFLINEINNQYELNYKMKIMKLNNFLSNNFIPNKNKDEVLNKFCSAQKHFNSLRYFLHLIKLKKAKISTFETDLCLTPLDAFKDNNKIKIYEKENNMFYIFRLSDLNNIINNNLCNSPNFFEMPLPIKNPLTNVSFSINNLYNIYFKMKSESFNMCNLFHLYFLSNFNLKEFKIKNMCVIRDEAIKHYVDNLTSILKINIINDLLYDYKYSINNIKINDNFPSYALLKAFSHLIIDYYIANYSLNPLLRNKSKEKILVFLKKFNRLNPLFGRKIIVIKKKINFRRLVQNINMMVRIIIIL